jgi:hypothetical protein
MMKRRAARRVQSVADAQRQLTELARVLAQDAPALAEVPFRLEPEITTSDTSTQVIS